MILKTRVPESSADDKTLKAAYYQKPMNFLRLPDGLLSVLFEDDDIVAIDKPYGFNSHTNDSKMGNSDLVQDGLIEIYEKQRGQKLHIIHRLDQTTTGVMIFGKSVESAKKYAEFFFQRLVKKTYWFVTKSVSDKAEFLIEQTIVHKGRELDAKTELVLKKKEAGFELWEAHPFTGRNHQIRIHAQSAGIPIFGDSKYEGAVFPFLNLHNHRIEFPNGIVIISSPPPYFENLDLLRDQTLAKALFEIDRRHRLFAQSHGSSECFREVHIHKKTQDPGYTLDHYGSVLVLNWYRERWGEEDAKRFLKLAVLAKMPILVRWTESQVRRQLVLNAKAELEAWLCSEGDVRYQMRVKQASNLFLNQRLQRSWVRQNAKGKSVLHLFSSTGGFALAAALGGAKQVISVEIQKNALNNAKENFVLNGINSEEFKFFCRDSFSFLEQSLGKKIKYDLIICECPSFFRREKGIFKIEVGLEVFLESCLNSLSEQGDLLFSTISESFYVNDLRSLFLKLQNKLQLQDFEIHSILPGLDFELPEEPLNLKSFLIRKGRLS